MVRWRIDTCGPDKACFFLQTLNCCCGSKPGSCTVPGMWTWAAASSLSAHSGVQCTASDFIHKYACMVECWSVYNGCRLLNMCLIIFILAAYMTTWPISIPVSLFSINIDNESYLGLLWVSSHWFLFFSFLCSVWVLSTGQGCQRLITEFFLAGHRRCANDMAKSNSVGRDSCQDSEGDMIFPAESSCTLPQDDNGEVRLGSSGAALPTRKRSRSFEEESNRAAEASPWDGVTKKTPRHRLFSSCTRLREVKQEAEDGLSQCSTVSTEPGQDIEDIGPDPFPDSYYGLLGTVPSQEVPSHICRLPSEVLRHIFAFLPVEDLYWNLSLVCHLWREIISDPLVS